jgi:hypothetical protein
MSVLYSLAVELRIAEYETVQVVLNGNMMGSRYASFTWLTVFQSSFRMPPVSPEFGFQHQNVQLMPLEPVPR